MITTETIELERAALPYVPGLLEQHWGLWMLNRGYGRERKWAHVQWVEFCEQDGHCRTVEIIQEEIIRLQVKYTQIYRLPDLDAVVAIKREIDLLTVELDRLRIENGELPAAPIGFDPGHAPILDALEQQDSVDDAVVLRSISHIDNLPVTVCTPDVKRTKRGRHIDEDGSPAEGILSGIVFTAVIAVIFLLFALLKRGL